MECGGGGREQQMQIVCVRGGGWVVGVGPVVVAVGAVAVQGEGGGDRAEEAGGAGEGVLHARPGRGGDQAPRLHPPGAGGDVGSDAAGGGDDTEAHRQGEPPAQAARQELPQEGEGIQGVPRGLQREEQRESNACEQVDGGN
uniref:Uncharacterized protein n=1 Tax=Oryza barthii TaxID=65489 RepID=A0A0D3F5W1_9ORYZ